MIGRIKFQVKTKNFQCGVFDKWISVSLVFVDSDDLAELATETAPALATRTEVERLALTRM